MALMFHRSQLSVLYSQIAAPLMISLPFIPSSLSSFLPFLLLSFFSLWISLLQHLLSSLFFVPGLNSCSAPWLQFSHLVPSGLLYVMSSPQHLGFWPLLPGCCFGTWHFKYLGEKLLPEGSTLWSWITAVIHKVAHLGLLQEELVVGMRATFMTEWQTAGQLSSVCPSSNLSFATYYHCILDTLLTLLVLSSLLKTGTHGLIQDWIDLHL